MDGVSIQSYFLVTTMETTPDLPTTLEACTLAIPSAGPINTLSDAGQLSLLLALAKKIIVLDVVYDEVTSGLDLKSKAIKDFLTVPISANQFVIEQTEVGQRERQKVSHGEKRSKNAGDIAITDFMTSENGLIKYLIAGDPVFICVDDADISTMRFIRKPANLHLISTSEMLRWLNEVNDGVIET